jgi:hypothetical protein
LMLLQNNFKLAASILLALTRTVLGGNVCLSSFVAAGLGDAAADVYWVTFAAGSPCDESRSYGLTDTLNENWCSIAERNPQFDMCGTTATMVNNGVEYAGRLLDSFAEDNPCAGSCNNGISFGSLSGQRIFEGVPMCD